MTPGRFVVLTFGSVDQGDANTVFEPNTIDINLLASVPKRDCLIKVRKQNFRVFFLWRWSRIWLLLLAVLTYIWKEREIHEQAHSELYNMS